MRPKSLKAEKIKSKDFEIMVQLRQKVLHPDGVRERVLYAFDDHEESFHLGIFSKEGELAACGSLLPESEGLKFSTSICRIRGMAVDPHFQKQGLGGLILEGLLEEAVRNKRSKVWCNARSSILDFYLRKDFLKAGEEFILPPNIPHYKLVKTLLKKST